MKHPGISAVFRSTLLLVVVIAVSDLIAGILLSIYLQESIVQIRAMALKDLFFILLYGLVLWAAFRSRFFAIEQANLALQESEERYRSVFENSLDGILLTSPDGRILAANPAACAMFRLSEAEICRLGRDRLVDLTDPNLRKALAEREQTGKVVSEITFLRGDGTRFQAEVSSNIFTCQDGSLRTSMILRDISERKQAEEALRIQQARFQILIDKMPALLWATDTDLRYTYVTGNALPGLGIDTRSLVGKKMGTVMGEKLPGMALIMEMHQRSLRGEATSYEFSLLGRIFHCDVEPMRDASGNISGCLAVGLDVTEHRLSERNVRKLSLAVEQGEDAVIITGEDGTIEYVNPAFERLTGYSSVEAVGRNADILKSGQHDPEFYERLWRTIRAGEVFRGEFTNRKKDGTLYVEEKTITPVRDEAGRITHFVATSKDVSERVIAYHNLENVVLERTREVQQLYQQAEQRSRALAALYNADEQLHRYLGMDQVLQSLVDVAVDILDADKSCVHLWDEQQDRLVLKASRGFSAESEARMQTYWAGEDLTGEVFVEGEPVALSDIAAAPPQRRQIAQEEGIRSILCVPIRLGEQTLGVFELDYREVHDFDDEERRFLLAFTQRAVMAVGNARLHEQAQQAAVLLERQRMARELHDSVTQSLYSLTLVAEAGRRLAASGEPAQAAQYIERMGETARQALKDMRLMVFEMRPFELAEIGLVRALQQRLEAVEKRAGIEAHLQVIGEPDLPEWLDEALYRIAQEALNNALKHAVASRIEVLIRGSDEWVEIEVSDNGVGFDTQTAVHQGGMGLENMLERARQIGAELRLISTPGEGTTVLVKAAIKPDQTGH